MKEYLKYHFKDDEAFIGTFDEIPLWSAAFGLFLFKHLKLETPLKVLDLGSGTGFPSIELAERLGKSSMVYGVDCWKNANSRAKLKARNYQVENVGIIETSAEQLPFHDQSIDLIVSNLGLNNFSKPDAALIESNRVLKNDGQLILTTNPKGHWDLFYKLFYRTLKQAGKSEFIPKLKKEEEHRGTVKSLLRLLHSCGFEVNRVKKEHFEMHFANGSAFLNHHFVKLGWLESWKELFPETEQNEIFSSLEDHLNNYAERNGGLKLRVPMLYIEAGKKMAGKRLILPFSQAYDDVL